MVPDPFIADLHIHSKFSRATSPNLDLENLYIWAQRKGITVVGTGDFTHPQWYSELSDKLEAAEPGLYRLRSDIARSLIKSVPVSCQASVRFLLSCEISNIYKKNDRTRKNHNLVFFPDLECVKKFNTRLETIGNIHSDGRPILGLDARDLLEIVLHTTEEGFLVPAHIWTPWFSMLGSKSGFDSIAECFDDLSPHIFAAETGLSSDPSMNWRVADLDDITLISNSDAHSPSKLGREANLFHTELNYYTMRSALEHGDKKLFGGTFEFYPEEGKYHVDGHRKCEVCFTPEQTRAHLGCCPVCGKPLTLGVLHRVDDLATRAEGYRPERSFPFFRLIPLEDLLSEILQVGAKSKRVQNTYRDLLERLGSEFSILHELDKTIIDKAGVPLLAEAIDRMRKNEVSFSPGYDGLFGKVRIFSEMERDTLLGQQSLFSTFQPKDVSNRTDLPTVDTTTELSSSIDSDADRQIEPVKSNVGLNAKQQIAVDSSNCSLLIIAGPGTGKTRTLTHKIAHTIQSGGDARQMVAVTFTNRAAGEMKDRIASLLDNPPEFPFVGTFHALGYTILQDMMDTKKLGIVDEKMRESLLQDSLSINDLSKKENGIRVADLMGWIASAKQKMLRVDDELSGVCPTDRIAQFVSCYRTYEHLLEINCLVDFEDLIFRTVQMLKSNESIGGKYIGRYTDIFIDEYQDINAGQYRLIRLLAGERSNLCIIGDPDQSIYGFRGSDSSCFSWFIKDYPKAKVIDLQKNYRSTQTILRISNQVIEKNPELKETGGRKLVHSDKTGDPAIHLLEQATDKAEAVAIGKTIEKMVGGTGFFSLDSDAVDGRNDDKTLSFSDFAILYRTRRQADPIFKTLENAGIPCQIIEKRHVLDHPGISLLISTFKILHGTGLFSDLQMTTQLFRGKISKKKMDMVKSWAYGNRFSMEQALVQARRLPIPGMKRDSQQKLYDCIGMINEYRETIDGLPIVDVLDIIIKSGGFKEKFKNDRQFDNGYTYLSDTGESFGNDSQGFMAAIALSSDTDVYYKKTEKVTLSTMHAAKGLEFSVVFIAGCEDEWIPFFSPTRPTEKEEERRLFFVALTRAEDHLFLTKSNHRRIHGMDTNRKWSPFVKDMDNRYKQFFYPSGLKKEKPVQEQLMLFGKR